MFNLFKAGDVIDKKHVVIERIARGGFGTVLKVKRLEDEAIYALKYCVGEDTDHDRFKREMEILEELHLEHVIRIVESELNHSPPYYVMPLAEGSLEDRVASFRQSEDALLDLFLKICRGIQGLHGRKCHHRDIKPQNILIIAGEPYIADFGIAKIETRFTTGITQTALGSFEYAAPELCTAEQARDADARSDIFSLGKLLYWLYTNRSPSHLDLDLVPGAARLIVRKATMIDVEKRYQNIECLISVIEFHRATLAEPVLLPAPRSNEPAGLQIAASAACDALSQRRPDAGPLARDFMDALFLNVKAIAPTYSQDGPHDEQLVAAIDESVTLVLEFQKVASAVARMNASEEALALYKGFRGILENFRLARGFSGHFRESDFDYYRFLGHELMACLFALLIRHDRWPIVSELVEDAIYVDNPENGETHMKGFEYASDFVFLLDHRNQRLKLQRLSLHADILNQRHTSTSLAELVPTDWLTDADFFLYLRSIFSNSEDDIQYPKFWRPWSTIHSPPGSPRFLQEAVVKKYAQKLLRPLGVSDIEEFRALLAKRGRIVERMYNRGIWTHPVGAFKTETIGTL
jgi:serine/threonine protein kinase